MRVNEGSFLDGLKFLFKLPRLSESVHSAFSSSVKSDYGAQKKEKKEKEKNRFWKFDLSAPDVKSASRNKHVFIVAGLSVKLDGSRTISEFGKYLV